MTPKEKAQQLINKYQDIDGLGYFRNEDGYLVWGTRVLEKQAKQCALIAIDEKIKLYNEINEYGHLLPNSFGFELHEIKTELEKL